MLPSNFSPRVGKFRPVRHRLTYGACLERSTAVIWCLVSVKCCLQGKPGRILLDRDWPVGSQLRMRVFGASGDYVVEQARAWKSGGGLIVDVVFCEDWGFFCVVGGAF